ncbi:MAG: PH domain-containing protein [Candidatus Micrarchaeota archaeon]|nr:PH domain-containing protein [Candidatus Micrarchaeota archaeon]
MAKIVAKPNLKVFFLFNYFYLVLISAFSSLLVLFSALFPLSLSLGAFLFFFLVFLAIFPILAAAIHSYLYYKNTSLVVMDEKLIYETGILQHSVVTVPLKSVTDYSLKRSFIQRFFNVATLSINTAGGVGFEIIADNFDYQTLAEIKTFLDSIKHHPPTHTHAHSHRSSSSSHHK